MDKCNGIMELDRWTVERKRRMKLREKNRELNGKGNMSEGGCVQNGSALFLLCWVLFSVLVVVVCCFVYVR